MEDKIIINKPMIYCDLHSSEIIGQGVYKDFNYYVLSCGSHPCGYVEIPKGNALYGVDYSDINCDIECHWGLTYSGDNLKLIGNKGKVWFIGWDYAHLYDYTYYEFNDDGGQQWETDEIMWECRNVINQIIDKY